MPILEAPPIRIPDHWLERLNSLRELEAGWNSYSAPAPSAVAIDHLKWFLGVAYREGVLPERVEPSAMGKKVPAMRKALDGNDQWLRVCAARALWKITGKPDGALPRLIEELRCRPVGLLAADCLGDMGRSAKSAIPALKKIVESEVRLVEIGSYNDCIDEDEASCEAAQQAQGCIEADIASR